MKRKINSQLKKLSVTLDVFLKRAVNFKPKFNLEAAAKIEVAAKKKIEEIDKIKSKVLGKLSDYEASYFYNKDKEIAQIKQDVDLLLKDAKAKNLDKPSLRELSGVLEFNIKKLENFEFVEAHPNFEPATSSLSESDLGHFILPKPAHVAICGRDKSIKLWDSDLNFIKSFYVDYEIHLISFWRSRFLICADDEKLMVWEIATETLIQTIHFPEISCFVVIGTNLVCGCRKGKITFFHGNPLSQSHVVEDVDSVGGCFGVTVLCDLGGNRLAESGGKSLKIWDLNTYTLIKTLLANKGFISEIIRIDDSRLCCAKSNDLQIWNIDTAECLTTLPALNHILCVMYLGNDKIVCSEGFNKNITFWCNQKEEGWVFKTKYTYSSVRSFAKVGNNLLSVEESGIISVFDITTFESIKILLEEPKGYASSICAQ